MNVPRPLAEEAGGGWVIDRFDEFGDLLETRKPNEKEFAYLAKFPAVGFDAWANKILIKSRLQIAFLWPNYRPGIWRGKPNPYAVK